MGVSGRPGRALTREPGDLPERSSCSGAGRAMNNGQSVAVTSFHRLRGIRPSMTLTDPAGQKIGFLGDTL